MLLFPAAHISLPTFFDFQCTATSLGNSSRILLPSSRIGFRSSLRDTVTAPNSRFGWIQRAGSTNSFDGSCFGEAVPKAVASMKESALAEDNFGDEHVKDRRGRVVIIAGPTGVGKTRLALALAGRLGGEIISADSVQVHVNFLHRQTSSCIQYLEIRFAGVTADFVTICTNFLLALQHSLLILLSKCRLNRLQSSRELSFFVAHQNLGEEFRVVRLSGLIEPRQYQADRCVPGLEENHSLKHIEL